MRRSVVLILVSLAACGSGCTSLAWKDRTADSGDPLRGGGVANVPEPRPDRQKQQPKEPSGTKASQLDDDPLVPGRSLPPTKRVQGAAPTKTPTTLAANPAALAATPPKVLSDDAYLGIDGAQARGPGAVEQARWSPPRPTWEQLQDALRSQGVDDYHLDHDGDTWRFRCFVPNPANPRVQKCLESESTDKIEAVLSVMRQLERKQ